MVLKSHEDIKKFMKHCRKEYDAMEQYTEMTDFLQRGLKELPKQPKVEIWDEFIEFFEAYDQEHNKVKTITMEKKAGGRKTDNCCTNYFLGWSKKKFIINYDGIMYGAHHHRLYEIDKK